jgi:hypothetical protein
MRIQLTERLPKYLLRLASLSIGAIADTIEEITGADTLLITSTTPITTTGLDIINITVGTMTMTTMIAEDTDTIAAAVVMTAMMIDV